MEYKDPGRYIPFIFLLYSWGSLFGVPSKWSLYSSVFRVNGLFCLDVREGLGFTGLTPRPPYPTVLLGA